MAKLLETRGLTKRFGGVTVIDDLNFSVEEGALHCLIGPNGAGKSTLFKLIVGRHRPTAGTIWFRGRDLTNLPTAERIRAGISIKMQVPGIFPELAGRAEPDDRAATAVRARGDPARGRAAAGFRRTQR